MRQLFKTHMLDKLAKSFRSGEDGAYFLYFGKPLSWSDENSPPTPVETTNEDIGIWENMLGAKRISSVKVIFMTDRLSRAIEITMAAALSDTDYFGDRFIFNTDEGYVYKVIKNGNASGAFTSGEFTNNYTTNTFGNNVDSYDYKLMYKIPDYLQEFITDTHIPILEVDVVSGLQTRYNDERQFRYNVKTDAVDGALDTIKIDNVNSGGTYSMSNYSTAEPFKYRPDVVDGYLLSDSVTVSTTEIQLAISETMNGVFNNASFVDNTYNGYAFYIKSGAGAGSVRRITDYVGASRTVTLSPALDIAPDLMGGLNPSRYFICPFVGITGDGYAASAIGLVNSNNAKLEEIDIINPGYGYTKVRATVSPVLSGDDYTLTPHISPKGGHGFSLLDEIRPTKMLVVVRIQKDEEGTAPIFNDYRQFGILADPLVSAGYTNEGLVAGRYDTTSTVMSVNAPTGGVFFTTSFQNGDLVIGKETNACGTVNTASLGGSEQKSVLLNLKDLKGNFKNSEEVLGIRNKGLNVWNNSLVGSGFVAYQEPTVPATDRTYRMTVSAGLTSDSVLNRDSILKDTLVSGASGATANIVQWTPFFGATGTSGSVLISNIIRESDSGGTLPLHGFVNNETVTIGASTYTINNVKGPELVKGSGRIVIAENTTPVVRTFEQEEEIRFFIDL